MDYPKSVPGVGLVNNQFVDEDAVSGAPGSLIPAAWGNAVTQELLAVIQAAGLVPSEANNAQLLAAIKSLSLGGVLTLSASATLPATSRGLVLVNATAAAVTVTLPAAETVGVLELTLRRTDAAANAAVIAANGTDRIMLDTNADAAGQVSTELLFSGDFLRLRSDGAGKWWCVGQAQLPGSIANGLVLYATPGAHTFTVPPVLRSGRRRARVTVIGGGGGGGGAKASANYNAAAGGGGAGGCARRLIDLTGVAAVSVTVATGGSGAASDVVIAGSGGSSSFGAYCSATGGTGGNSVGGGTAIAGCAAGGGGGGAAGGSINASGGGGQSGVAQYATLAGSTVSGGHGGVSALSGGSAYGAGGRGASTVANTVAGETGSHGAVLIEW